MRGIVKKFATAFVLVCPIFFAEAVELIEERITHTSFPLERVVEHRGYTYNLGATGVSTASQDYTKVYSVAHYLQNPIKFSRKLLLERIFRNDVVKELVIQWVRSLAGGAFREIFHKSFETTMNKEQLAVAHLSNEKILSFFPNGVQKGDFHIYRWLAGGEIEFEVNGSVVGTINTPGYAPLFWAVWLGPNSVVNRNQLLSLAIEKPLEEPVIKTLKPK